MQAAATQNKSLQDTMLCRKRTDQQCIQNLSNLVPCKDKKHSRIFAPHITMPSPIHFVRLHCKTMHFSGCKGEALTLLKFAMTETGMNPLVSIFDRKKMSLHRLSMLQKKEIHNKSLLFMWHIYQKFIQDNPVSTNNYKKGLI